MSYKIPLIFIFILLLSITCGIYLFKINNIENKLKAFDNSVWTCIAQVCDNIYNENEWVKNNCELIEGNMTCRFNWENKPYNFQLNNINVTYMLENKVGNYCSLKCQTEVLIRSL
jgi:hypothetical protein